MNSDTTSTNQQLIATWRASWRVASASLPTVSVNTGAALSGLMIGNSVTGTSTIVCSRSISLIMSRVRVDAAAHCATEGGAWHYSARPGAADAGSGRVAPAMPRSMRWLGGLLLLLLAAASAAWLAARPAHPDDFYDAPDGVSVPP